MRVQTRVNRVLGRVCRGGYLPSMRRGDLEDGGEGHPRSSMINVKGRQPRSIYAPTSFGYTTKLGSAAQLNTSLMEGNPRGRGRDFINRGSPGITMFIWVGSGVLMLSLVLTYSDPGLIYSTHGLIS